jgi:hypothetical protein
MKNVPVAATICFLVVTSIAQAQLAYFNKYTREVLNTFVSNGVADYKGLTKNRTQLKQAIEALETINLDSLQGDEKKAFLINAYNILVINAIVEKGAKTGVMKIPGFFDRNQYKIGGTFYTLNRLEKEVLFKKFTDARLHFALVCGAVSCPPLGSVPFTANNLDHELENITRRALNGPQLIALDMEKKTVTVSKIFEWYKADFAKAGGTIDFINHYRVNKIPIDFSVTYADYSWQLNGK